MPPEVPAAGVEVVAAAGVGAEVVVGAPETGPAETGVGTATADAGAVDTDELAEVFTGATTGASKLMKVDALRTAKAIQLNFTSLGAGLFKTIVNPSLPLLVIT